MKCSFYLLCTALMLLTSCTSWHIKGEDSPGAGPNPLASYNMRFRVSRLTLQSSGAPRADQNIINQTKISQAAIQNKLYEKYPDFFQDKASSFPIDIDISVNQQQNMHAGFFLMYMCTLGILPAKNSLEIDSSISILPANPKHASMFSINEVHNTHIDMYFTAFSPIGLMAAQKAVGENEANSHAFGGAPSQFKEPYLNGVCKAIIAKLSQLKVTNHRAVNVKHQIVEEL
ncbi:MAG: hypothetical protein HRT88_03455 [Lentisphaeraceae bacterium]|nr:hypothetical protein [Lentisphaeraceae bacterium]